MKTRRLTKFLSISTVLAVVACTEELPQKPGGQASGGGQGADVECKTLANCEVKANAKAELMSLWSGKDLVFVGADDKATHCISSESDFSSCTIYDLKTKTKKKTNCTLETKGGKKSQNISFSCGGKTKADCAGFEGIDIDHPSSVRGNEVVIGGQGKYAHIRATGACEANLIGAGNVPTNSSLKDLVGSWSLPCKPDSFLFSEKTEYIFGANGEGHYSWTIYGDCENDERDFSAIAEFTYTGGEEAIAGKKLNMTIKSLKLIALNNTQADAFNQSKNCGISNWKSGEARDVTNATCEAGLTFKKDTQLFNIYKVEENKLLMGSVKVGLSKDVGNNGMQSEAQRPVRLDTDQPLSKDEPNTKK